LPNVRIYITVILIESLKSSLPDEIFWYNNTEIKQTNKKSFYTYYSLCKHFVPE